MSPLALTGLVVMVGSEGATLARIEPFWSWNTPIAWTGFIVFADSIVFTARGQSWLRSAPREFFWMSLASIPLWLVFEFYNLFIDNWHYVGLPENPVLRNFGYAWAFATIWPAIFEAAELVAVWRGLPARPPSRLAGPHPRSLSLGVSAPRSGRRRSLPALLAAPALPALLSVLVGLALLSWPLVWPSRYLAAPVWVGFIFLLDPINARFGGESLIQDLRQRRFERIENLMLSGLLCGVLWEFWNYWSRTKWHYTVPILTEYRLFEMPIPGYLGFPAFALECFTMYIFVRQMAHFFSPVRTDRSIAL